MNLIDVSKRFASDEACLGYLEKMRWPEGVACLKCQSMHVCTVTKKEGKRERFSKKLGKTVEVRVPAQQGYQCLDCDHQFSCTAGTIFHDTHLPLHKWFLAVAILCDAKKSMSANQMMRHLGIGSYRTAWYLNHRIRKAMAEITGASEKMTGTVEVDETYIGGKYDKRRKRERWNKDPVVGIIARGGKVRTFPVKRVNAWNVVNKIKEHVSTEAELVITDESKIYDRLPRHGYQHDIVNHSRKEYVRGEVHTNHIENQWSLFKRGVIGSFHKISIKHLHRYLAEFDYRFNNRESENLFALTIINLLIGIAIQYKELVADPDASSDESTEPF